MSRFYASIRGSQDEATRQGTTDSGIEGHVHGWAFGVRVFVDENKNGNDEARIYLTGGSYGKGTRLLGRFTRDDLLKEDGTAEKLVKAVLDWARTPGNHGGNPYSHNFVKLARKLAGE